MGKGVLRAAASRVAAASLAALISIGAYQATPAVASVTTPTTPEDLETALSALTPEQDAAFGAWLESLLDDVDLAAPLRHFATLDDSPLQLSLSSLLSPAAPTALDPVGDVLNLLPSALRYEWQTTVGATTRTHAAVLNVPSLLDVDATPGPDVLATLAINGTSGVTLSVDRLATAGGLLAAPALPLRIEAIVADPRGGPARFAFGYDGRAATAPATYSESVTVGSVAGSTQVTVQVNQSGAGSALTLIAEQFTGASSQRIPDQTLAVALAPVPPSVHASVTVGSGFAVNFGAGSPTVATVDYVRYTSGTALPVKVTLDRLPTNLGITLTQASGDTQLRYTASAVVNRITARADNLTGLGDAKIVTLTLGNVPTQMTLQLAGAGDSFDLDTHGADLGLLEAALTSSTIQTLPAQYDGVLVRKVPGLSLLFARINSLRRVSGKQAPLSMFLDSTAGRAFRVDLRERPSATAKETYTLADLSALARSTSVAIQDGAQQRISYGAATATGSFSFATNAGNRQSLTASAAPVPASIAICAAGGNNGCSTSGKPGGTASFRVATSQHMTVNLFDCQTSGCGTQLRLTDFNLRLVDLAVQIGKSCSFLGCLPNGSKGNIWLDTDAYTMRGTVRSQSPDFTVQAGFGNGFWANNRYVTWDYFIPSKSGSISCTSGTYLNVTVFGITIDVSGLYLC